jgi:hypothetical protein
VPLNQDAEKKDEESLEMEFNGSNPQIIANVDAGLSVDLSNLINDV